MDGKFTRNDIQDLAYNTLDGKRVAADLSPRLPQLGGELASYIQYLKSQTSELPPLPIESRTFNNHDVQRGP